ncbi:MAG: hypothetical protein PHE25_02505 [Candidatus Gracilibacteria bacterium]|nr:hypothetical protein [Candidatus Gracilibacteria bacterium]
MIKKIFRLSEGQIKKVLKYGKPFFSFGIVSNSIINNLPYNRFAIVIGAKTVNNNISRNFFRRKFYDLVSRKINFGEKNMQKDFVFIIKKQIKLDKKDFESITSFEKDLNFLLKKI